MLFINLFYVCIETFRLLLVPGGQQRQGWMAGGGGGGRSSRWSCPLPYAQRQGVGEPQLGGQTPWCQEEEGKGAGPFILSLYTCSQFRPFSHPSVLRWTWKTVYPLDPPANPPCTEDTFEMQECCSTSVIPAFVPTVGLGVDTGVPRSPGDSGAQGTASLYTQQ